MRRISVQTVSVDLRQLDFVKLQSKSAKILPAYHVVRRKRRRVCSVSLSQSVIAKARQIVLTFDPGGINP